MKRILILNYEFPPLGGGAANATYYLLKELSTKKEVQIDLVTSSIDEYREEEFSENIRVYRLDIGKKGNIHYQSNKDLLMYLWKAYRFAKKLTKTNKYSVIHAFFGIPCGYIAMKLGVPYIVSLRGSDVPFYNKRFYLLDKLIFKRLSRKIWLKASKVVANSQGLKELALKSAPEQSIEVIYNGVDINEFKPSETENSFSIISTSRLTYRKGIEYLIEGFNTFNLDNQRARLIIIGDGDLGIALKSKSKSNGQIKFLGKIEHSKLKHYYSQADIFALPSLNEGMSNALLEAMASGLAIIATNTGGTSELIDHTNGFIVKKKDSKAITSALATLYKNRKLLKSMKISSRKKSKMLSWTQTAKKYLTMYHSI